MMSFIPPARDWLLSLGLLITGWYSSIFIPVDKDITYEELTKTRALHEECIQVLATTAGICFENTELLFELNDHLNHRTRKTGNKSLDLSPSEDAGEVLVCCKNIGISLVFQREALRYLLKTTKERHHGKKN
jgi:hypothetical protein